ncbi:MAG: MBL fold metallo-hydrolase [Alphaproteobacteria bacterium]
MRWRSFLGLGRLVVGLVSAVVLGGGAAAKCLPIAAAPGAAQVVPVSAPADGEIRLSFLGHSSFLIETAGGASAVTDYFGLPLPFPPDVATMNNAHSSHYTDFPDPKIGQVLRGWATEAGIASYDVTVKDLRVWNVPTNVRDYGGTRFNGNSIFVFEADGMCIAHLGHLHHTLTDQHLADLGQIDVLLVPADGSYTISHSLLVEVIEQIGPSMIVPMHYFGALTLSGLLGRLEDDGYAIDLRSESAITVSRLTMPHRTVVVLGDG